MTRYKLGRLPAVRPHALADMGAYSRGRLPAPPAQVDPPNMEDWGVDGNDTLGDCTIAGVDHLIAAWNAETGIIDDRPDTPTITAEYLRLSGGADTGLVEADVLRTWRTDGLFGTKIAAYAPVQPKDITGLHQAVAFYGGAYLGIECPDSCQEQFANNEPWTVVQGARIEGGHCIVAVGYDQQYVYCVTWGKVVQVAYPFLAAYLDEAWCIVGDQYARRNNGPIDLDTLIADLNTL